jgi:hypothetical protein
MTQQFPPQWHQPGEQPPPPYGAHAMMPQPKKKRRWPLYLLGGVVGLFVISLVANSGDDPRPAATPVQVTTPAAVAPQPTPEQAVASGPLTAFGAGTYEVGTVDGQVAPGKYKTAGPAGGSPSCYWARLKDTDGDFDSIITNGNAEGPTVVTISKADGAFETRCTWTKAG